ncbi:MAG: hypothetical protein ABEJ31_03290 [Haloarculaceae archaeon]
MSPRRFAPVAVALLLALAGCGAGPTGTTPTETPDQHASPTPTPTSTNDTGGPGGAARYRVTVENGSLPFNATRTYARVQSLLGTDVAPRPVVVRNLSEWRGSLRGVAASPLNRALGFENVTPNWSSPSGVTVRTGRVYLHPGRASAGAVERTLAHEFAHAIQERTGMLPWERRLSRGGRMTVDQRKTRGALIEGGAVYVADAYADRYLDVRNNTALVERLYRNGSATYRSAFAQYRYGARYVRRRIDSPRNLSAVYRHPPRTTEQLMHGLTRAEEPPANLSVTRAGAGDQWRYVGDNTLGELTLLSTLDVALNRSRSAAAAAGWGTDELLVYARDPGSGPYGWTWVLRDDDPAEAAELESALREFADARANASTQAFRVTSVDDRTVALTFGDPAFVANATATATDDGGVRVAVGG